MPSTFSSCLLSIRSRQARAFTLIELLVVISIIAILAAVAFPVFGSVRNRARTVEAVSDMRNLKTAVASFYADYGKYPMTPGQEYAAQNGAGANNDTRFGDGGYYATSDLMNILRGQPDDRYGTDNRANPNQTVYWSGPFAKSATQPRSGITTQDSGAGATLIRKGSLVDPWGKEYLVFVNVTKSGNLTGDIAGIYSDYSPETDQNRITCGLPPLGVECACLGPDGTQGTKGNRILKGSDDIVTWPHQ